MSDLDLFWGQILGREPDTIRAAWGELTSEEQEAVYAHLQRMVHEDGWADPQRISAQAALDALAEIPYPPPDDPAPPPTTGD